MADGERLIAVIEQRGEFVAGDDGYICYWPNEQGALTSHNLRTIADELDRRNEQWNQIVNASH